MCREAKLTKHSIDRFFKSLGVPQLADYDELIEHLESRYGDERRAEIEEAFESRADGDYDSFYDFIYSDTDVSIQLAGMRANLYRTFFNWFESNFSALAGRILDVGCGNGIATCYLAKQFPKARFVGIDKSPAAIRCATELAQKAKVKNVEFQHSSFSEFSTKISDKFSMIVSLTGLSPDEIDFPVGDEREAWAEKVASQAMNSDVVSLVQHLAPGGTFVSVDRCRTDTQKFAWLAALQNAGMTIDLLSSGEMTFTDLTGTETLPIIVGALGSTRMTSAELLSFCMDDGVVFDRLSPGDRNLLSEFLFASFANKQRVSGWRAAFYDGSGTCFYEIWRSGIFVLNYTHSTIGYRDLKIEPLYKLSLITNLIDEQMELLHLSAEVSKL